jgi:hypothetical protein
MENVDPVSGNPVPPGSLPAEVRDDIDIKASEGEYMLPADVVKYFGLDYIEKLVNKAKAGMEELQANGRIGGKGEDELPFSPEELVAHEQEMVAPAQEVPVEGPPQMAEGGFVSGIKQKPLITFKSKLPLWMNDQAAVGQQPTESEKPVETPKTGFAQSVDKWSPQDYSDYAKSQTNPVKKVAERMASGIFPPIGLAIKMATNQTNKSAVSRADQMLTSGLDQAGNPLTKEDRAALQEARGRIAETKPSGGGGLADMITNVLGKIADKKDPAKKETEKKDSSSSGSKDRGSVPTTTKKKDDPLKMSKGGLVKRR